MTRFRAEELDGRNVGSVFEVQTGDGRIFGTVETLVRNGDTVLLYPTGWDDPITLRLGIEVEIHLGPEAKFLMHINNEIQSILAEVQEVSDTVSREVAVSPSQIHAIGVPAHELDGDDLEVSR